MALNLEMKMVKRLKKEVYHVTWNVDAAEKGWYEDFMLKEIHEQP